MTNKWHTNYSMIQQYKLRTGTTVRQTPLVVHESQSSQFLFFFRSTTFDQTLTLRSPSWKSPVPLAKRPDWRESWKSWERSWTRGRGGRRRRSWGGRRWSCLHWRLRRRTGRWGSCQRTTLTWLSLTSARRWGDLCNVSRHESLYKERDH